MLLDVLLKQQVCDMSAEAKGLAASISLHACAV